MKAAELNLPTKTEIIVDVELTAVQMKYYREMYERNIDTLADVEHERASEKGGAPAVSNLMMELRKVPVCVCVCVCMCVCVYVCARACYAGLRICCQSHINSSLSAAKTSGTAPCLAHGAVLMLLL